MRNSCRSIIKHSIDLTLFTRECENVVAEIFNLPIVSIDFFDCINVPRFILYYIILYVRFSKYLKNFLSFRTK